MKITFSKAAPAKSGAVIIPCFEASGGKSGFGDAFAAINEESGGALAKAAKTGDFSGKKDQLLEIVAPEGLGSSRIVLAGAGKPDAFTLHDAEALGGNAISRILKTQEKAAAIALEEFSLAPMTALATSQRMWRSAPC